MRNIGSVRFPPLIPSSVRSGAVRKNYELQIKNRNIQLVIAVFSSKKYSCISGIFNKKYKIQKAS